MKMLRSLIALPVRRFIDDEKGATAIEYAMIAAGIGAAIAATVTLLGTEVGKLYESITAAWPA